MDEGAAHLCMRARITGDRYLSVIRLFSREYV